MDKRNTIDRRPMGMIFCGSHFFTLLMCFCVNRLGLGFGNLSENFV